MKTEILISSKWVQTQSVGGWRCVGQTQQDFASGVQCWAACVLQGRDGQSLFRPLLGAEFQKWFYSKHVSLATGQALGVGRCSFSALQNWRQLWSLLVSEAVAEGALCDFGEGWVSGQADTAAALTAAPELIHGEKQPLSHQSLQELLRAGCELFVNSHYD